MLEMHEWELFWAEDKVEAWKRSGKAWRNQLEAEGKTESEIQAFYRKREQYIHNHPLIRLHDSIQNTLFALQRFKPWRSHWQDLNDDGRHLIHGRGWVYPFPNLLERRCPHVGFSWCIPTSFCHAYVELEGGGDEELTISFACWLFAIWISCENIIPYKWLPKGGRKTGLSIHDGSIWIDIWHDDSGWVRDRFKWQDMNFSFVDFLLGEPKYTRNPGTFHQITLEFPEATYPATIELYEAVWDRARWFPLKMKRAEIVPSSPVPIPGKGENSWDLDEDAVYQMGCVAETLDEAIATFKASVERSRRRYGGENWVPEAYQVS